MKVIIINEITKPGDLLNIDGTLSTSGWAKSLILNYNKFNIKASPARIKEWDRYIILNDKYALMVSIEDYFYLGLISASIVDFKDNSWHTNTFTKIFASNKIHMSLLSHSGDTTFNTKRVGMNFSCSKGKRFIKCEFVNFLEGKSLYINLTLSQPNQDTIVNVTPFKQNPKFFSYNQKINLMKASGIVKFGGYEFKFNEKNSFAFLNWNRGVWPSSAKWCQATCSCKIGDNTLGFNIGYGFGDNPDTENAIFYNGQIQKLNNATIQKPKDNILKSWNIYTDDNRLKMKFNPIIKNDMNISKLVLSSNRTQLFGYFSGLAALDNGVVFKVKDMLGYLEVASVRW